MCPLTDSEDNHCCNLKRGIREKNAMLQSSCGGVFLLGEGNRKGERGVGDWPLETGAAEEKREVERGGADRQKEREKDR